LRSLSSTGESFLALAAAAPAFEVEALGGIVAEASSLSSRRVAQSRERALRRMSESCADTEVEVRAPQGRRRLAFVHSTSTVLSL
jgi:methyl coenzyme M reductase gamma subunit